MDKSNYTHRMIQTLSDDKYWTLRRDATMKVKNRIASTLKRLHNDGHIDEKTRDFLTPRFSSAPHMYGLPKVHKVANLYMEHLEETALRTAPDPPRLWLRCVDDAFVIWLHGKEKLGCFHEHLSMQHRNIKFTVEHEKENKLAFLDVQVTRTNNRLTTRVYSTSGLVSSCISLLNLFIAHNHHYYIPSSLTVFMLHFINLLTLFIQHFSTCHIIYCHHHPLNA